MLSVVMISCPAAADNPANPNSSITITLAGVNFAPASATGVANNTSTFPAPLISVWTGVGATSGGAGSASSVATATTSVSGSTVLFSGFTPSGGAVNYTITGLRANIAATGLTDGVITFSVNFTSGATASTGTGVIARVVRGLHNTNAQVWSTNGNGSAIPNNFPSCAPPRATPSGSTALTTAATFNGVGNANLPGALFSQAELLVDIRDNVNNAITGVNDQLTMTYRPRLDPTSATVAPSANFLTEDYGGVTGPGADFIFGTADDIFGGAINGTRFMVTLTGIPSGITVWAPRSNPANASGLPGAGATGTTAIMVRVVAADADGSGGAIGTPVRNQLDRIDPVGGTAVVVYEWVAIQAGGGAGANAGALNTNLILTGAAPIATGVVQGSLNLAPIGPPTTSTGRPQFAGGRSTRTVANIAACGSYLLFPWVAYTGEGAYDTGMAIANTSADPAGPQPGGINTPPQTGDVTLYFWRKDGGTNPAPQTIAKALPAGQVTTFLASSLKDSFVGYIIAVCGFPFGHGFAFINSPAPGTGGSFAEGYIALSLANPRAPSAGVSPVFVEGAGH
jgi:hypothetical protein